MSSGFDQRFMDREHILFTLAALGRPFSIPEYLNLVDTFTGVKTSELYLRGMFYFHKIAWEGVDGWELDKSIIEEYKRK